MIPIACLFRDIYNDRWGDPRNPAQRDLPVRVGPFRRLRRPSAWSLTIPIDEHLR
ncbi:hypothetical protein OIU34_29960 [Pararhizobium sp. BT-229]|uniref:hypothetical protein n=1 Tax=Pararhizobium sp. BT-229 TaxID=2986923 RepID=UPI0021F7D894|nr:hypothetical protein [Pararhizobium sp. BT-229]MCV9966101.1 hypothetical protein [Pararhizobium sp. BT-229]